MPLKMTIRHERRENVLIRIQRVPVNQDTRAAKRIGQIVRHDDLTQSQ